MSAQTQPAAPKASRITSIDAVRGFVMFTMIFVNDLAGAPKEAMGFRTPGEKTMYEVQSLENAAGRIFQAKINQFEEQQVEPDLNAMLELARRNMDQTVVRVVDDEFKIATFKTLTPSDITGVGRIRPVAARHFAEKAQRLQNISGLFNSKLGEMIMPHTSSVKMSQLADSLLEIEDWNIFQPYIQVVEQAEAQKMANAAHEEVLQQAQTPAGIVPGDTPAAGGGPPQGAGKGGKAPRVQGQAAALPPNAGSATPAPAGAIPNGK